LLFFDLQCYRSAPAVLEDLEVDTVAFHPEDIAVSDFVAGLQDIAVAFLILEEGAIGALLRREGLYSSQLATWRRQYRSGALTALKDNKRGRKRTKNPLEDEVARLQRENARLGHRLEQAETIIEIQKKVSTMLGIPLKDEASEGND